MTGKAFQVEGLVCERAGVSEDKHYIQTADRRMVFAAGLLQYFVGKWVTVTITESAPESSPAVEVGGKLG